MKTRLDVLLTEKGFFNSREKAKTAIMAGLVYVNGQISDKAGTAIPEDAIIEVRGNDCPYVSRGGFKLEKALETFNIDVSGFHCVDIGASTGGFTDCLLQKDAEKVYAIDSGYNQLDYKLRVDSRVVCMEKENFRYFDPERLGEKLDFACADVSFISLKHIFPVAVNMLKNEGSMACLVKPQFEAGREQVGKNGIVKDPEIHREVIENVINYAKDCGLYAESLSYSPITGGKSGNIEFLLYLKLIPSGKTIDIDQVIKEAHAAFDRKGE